MSIKGELRKSFDKLWLGFLLVCVAVNGYFFYTQQSQTHGWLFDDYKEYKRAVTEGLPSDSEDIPFFSHFLQQQQQHIDAYPAYILEMPERARQANNLARDENSFAVRNSNKTTRDFADLETLPLKIGLDIAVEEIYQFPMTDILLVMCVLFSCIRLFGMEHERGLLNLLMATPSRGRIALQKMLSLLLCVLASTAALYAVNLIIGHALFGLGGLSRPIQSIATFRSCNLRLSCGEYLLYGAGMKALTVFALGLIVLALFVWLKSTPVVLLIVSGGAGLEFLLYQSIPVSSSINVFRFVNIFHLTDSFKLLGWYQNINLFGYPVNMMVVWPVITALAASVSAAFIYLRFKTGSLVRKTIRFPFVGLIRDAVYRRTDRFSRHTTLIPHELYKLLLPSFVIFAALISMMVHQVTTAYTVEDSEELAYQDYIEEIGGRITPDTVRFIEDEWAYLMSLPPEQASMYQAAIRALSRVETQVNTAMEREATNGTEAWLLNDAGFLRLMNTPSLDAQDTIMLSIAALLLCGGIFAGENTSGIKKLLRISPNGTRLMLYKLAVTFLLCLTAAVIVYGARYLTVAKLFTLEYWNAPVQNVSALSEYTRAASIFQYMLHCYTVRVIGILALALCVSAVSSLCRYNSIAFVGIIALLIAPVAAYQSGLMPVQYVSIFPLLYGNLFLQNSIVPYICAGAAYCAASGTVIRLCWRKGMARKRGSRREQGIGASDVIAL